LFHSNQHKQKQKQKQQNISGSKNTTKSLLSQISFIFPCEISLALLQDLCSNLLLQCFAQSSIALPRSDFFKTMRRNQQVKSVQMIIKFATLGTRAAAVCKT
jgi:hypothetical protein